jgi:hypothetical protein
MATAPFAVSKFVTKSHAFPDELRTPIKTRVEIVRLPGFVLGRFTLDPGWRWSECVRPVDKTELCPNSHIGYVISGVITVRLKDGTEKTISAGESYAVPPGRDAWVEGNERLICIEVLSAERFAKPVYSDL